jgi:hypothetical protein
MKSLHVVPLDLESANAFVDRHHRHHDEVVGHKFSLGAVHAGEIVGVVIVGRPVAKGLQDGWTLEVTRLATDEVERMVTDRHGRQHPLGVCSFLYGAARRATFALGYTRLGTYILASEPGVTLVAAGWRLVGEVRGRSWNTRSRPRVDKHPTLDKARYEAAAD